jgi:hypothetical protein
MGPNTFTAEDAEEVRNDQTLSFHHKNLNDKATYNVRSF